jgi:SAM-dependent methyltransferase
MFGSYAEIFAERGAAYHHAMAMCPNARDAEFRAVLEPLAGRTGLLCDMPSGGGYLAAHLPSGMRYIGVDPSDDFIDACPAGVERIKADITNVPLPDASFDCLVSLAALHHEPDLPVVFREMRRLLKRGGRAVIADVAVNTPPASFLNGFVDANNPMGHHGHFIHERTAGVIEEAGFSIADDMLVDMPWRFDSLAEAGAFCRQLFWMPKLNADEVAAAMDREIGFDLIDGRPRLGWVLRRIVCDAV